MKKIRIKSFKVLIAFLGMLSLFSCTVQPEINTLIVTGQNNHNWGRSHVALKGILETTEIFNVEVATSPGKGKDMSEFILDFTPYDLVVLDYNGDEWPEETKTNFVNFVNSGGGVVVYHAADNAFPNWKEYNEIIGLGGWGRRDETSGPYVYVKNGEVIRDDSPGRGGSHGPQHEFVVETFKPEHPVMKGLPEKWLHVKDELYSQMRGPAKNIEILASAYASKEYNGTERNEPVLFTINYGKGRIFHTTIGHSGNNAVIQPAMQCAGFITTLQRGAEWAATGKVLQEVPEGLPTETETVKWPFYQKMDLEIISELIADYEIGKLNNCFFALGDMIRENLDNSEKMQTYHETIKNLLKSRKTSEKAKKILLKDFAWVADDSYKPIYEALSSNEELKNEVSYALETLGY